MIVGMKTLQRGQDNKLWDKFWDDMKTEWFKLEVLQDYAAEDEGPSLQKWLAGDQKASLELMKIDEEPDFTADCHKKQAKGVKMTRIHLIERPLTPYMQWEIEFYKRFSVPLRGERVYLAEKSKTAGLDLPSGDLMIFDRRRAVLNKYNAHGLCIARDYFDESDDISKYIALIEPLMAIAKAV